MTFTLATGFITAWMVLGGMFILARRNSWHRRGTLNTGPVGVLSVAGILTVLVSTSSPTIRATTATPTTTATVAPATVQAIAATTATPFQMLTPTASVTPVQTVTPAPLTGPPVAGRTSPSDPSKQLGNLVPEATVCKVVWIGEPLPYTNPVDAALDGGVRALQQGDIKHINLAIESFIAAFSNNAATSSQRVIASDNLGCALVTKVQRIIGIKRGLKAVQNNPHIQISQSVQATVMPVAPQAADLTQCGAIRQNLVTAVLLAFPKNGSNSALSNMLSGWLTDPRLQVQVSACPPNFDKIMLITLDYHATHQRAAKLEANPSKTCEVAISGGLWEESDWMGTPLERFIKIDIGDQQAMLHIDADTDEQRVVFSLPAGTYNYRLAATTRYLRDYTRIAGVEGKGDNKEIINYRSEGRRVKVACGDELAVYLCPHNFHQIWLDSY